MRFWNCRLWNGGHFFNEGGGRDGDGGYGGGGGLSQGTTAAEYIVGVLAEPSTIHLKRSMYQALFGLPLCFAALHVTIWRWALRTCNILLLSVGGSFLRESFRAQIEVWTSLFADLHIFGQKVMKRLCLQCLAAEPELAQVHEVLHQY